MRLICLGLFDTVLIKNTGVYLLFEQFYGLLLKRIIYSRRNHLILITTLLPALFVFISLIIQQKFPKPEDSPPLLISLDRYRKTYVPYIYSQSALSSIEFIHAYESILTKSPKLLSLIDLTRNNTDICREGNSTSINSYLICIGKRSLSELNDHYLIGTEIKEDTWKRKLNIIGYFNNQPYHAPSLSLNYITNTLLKQYSPNRRIQVINHPVSFKE